MEAIGNTRECEICKCYFDFDKIKLWQLLDQQPLNMETNTACIKTHFIYMCDECFDNSHFSKIGAIAYKSEFEKDFVIEQVTEHYKRIIKSVHDKKGLFHELEEKQKEEELRQKLNTFFEENRKSQYMANRKDLEKIGLFITGDIKRCDDVMQNIYDKSLRKNIVDSYSKINYN